MPTRKQARSARVRMGRVSLYRYQGAWWMYYRDGGVPVRRKVARTRPEAEQVAAQVNAQLVTGAPTLLAFTPISGRTCASNTSTTTSTS
jgi:integrase